MGILHTCLVQWSPVGWPLNTLNSQIRYFVSLNWSIDCWLVLCSRPCFAGRLSGLWGWLRAFTVCLELSVQPLTVYVYPKRLPQARCSWANVGAIRQEPWVTEERAKQTAAARVEKTGWSFMWCSRSSAKLVWRIIQWLHKAVRGDPFQVLHFSLFLDGVNSRRGVCGAAKPSIILHIVA